MNYHSKEPLLINYVFNPEGLVVKILPIILFIFQYKSLLAYHTIQGAYLIQYS
jgi:hypothetical protein